MIWIDPNHYREPVNGNVVEGIENVMTYLHMHHASKIRQYIGSRNRGFSPAISQGVFGEFVQMDSRSCVEWMFALEDLTMNARGALLETTEVIPGVGIRSNGEWLWNKEIAATMLNELIANQSLREAPGETQVQRVARRELIALDRTAN